MLEKDERWVTEMGVKPSDNKSKLNNGLEGHWRKAESGNYPPINKLTCQSDDVLVQSSTGEMFIAFLDGTRADITWLDCDRDRIFDVIAWQPLPKPMAL